MGDVINGGKIFALTRAEQVYELMEAAFKKRIWIEFNTTNFREHRLMNFRYEAFVIVVDNNVFNQLINVDLFFYSIGCLVLVSHLTILCDTRWTLR